MKPLILLLLLSLGLISFTPRAVYAIYPTEDMTSEDIPISIDQAHSYAETNYKAYIEAVVTQITQNLIFFQDPDTGTGTFLFLTDDNRNQFDGVVPGELVRFLSELNHVTAFQSNHIHLKNFQLVQNTKEQAAFVIDDMQTAESIINLHSTQDMDDTTPTFLTGRIFTLENIRFTDITEHGEVFFVDNVWEGNTQFDMQLFYTFSNNDIDSLSELNLTPNQSIQSFTFIVYKVSFGNLEIIPLSIELADAVITLNGQQYMSIEQYENFIDPGIEAHDGLGNPYTIVTSGQVNNEVPGEYELIYDIKDDMGNIIKTLNRIVNVKGERYPTITLNGEPTITVAYGDEYNDQGATAINVDDVIYDVISHGHVNINEAGIYTIEYTTTANDGTIIGPITRTVIVENAIAPTFQAPTTIIKNADYIAPAEFYLDHIEAFDFQDKNITSNIEIVRNDYLGNANIPGSYEIVFRVTDEQNITSRHTLTINVNGQIAPLLIIDNDTIIQSYNHELTYETIINTFITLGILDNETFAFTDIYDNYTSSYDTKGTYVKEFSLLSETGEDHHFSLMITVIENDDETIDKDDGFMDTAINLIKNWWILLLVAVVITVGLKTKR